MLLRVFNMLSIILTVKFPIYGPNSEDGVTAVGSIGTDITERKRAEEARLEEESRFRAVFGGDHSQGRGQPIPAGQQDLRGVAEYRAIEDHRPNAIRFFLKGTG